MAPRPAPRSGCPDRPALPIITDRELVTTDRERAVIGRIFQTPARPALFVTTDR